MKTIFKFVTFYFGILLASFLFFACSDDASSLITITSRTCTISYETSYGTAPKSKTVDVSYEITSEDLPILSSNSNFTFKGWSKTENGTTFVQEGTIITKNTVLYAIWLSSDSIYVNEAENYIYSATSDINVKLVGELSKENLSDIILAINSILYKVDLDLSETTGISAIYNEAFSNCQNLKSISLPKSVLLIGNKAFMKCYNLSNVAISSGVKVIGSYAFSDCTSLESITVPSNVSVIGDYAFTTCTKLKTVNLPSSITKISNGLFNFCTNLESITIPTSVTNIGEKAFYKCEGLQSLKIPESVTEIGYGAFSDCSNLSEITLPESITSIADYLFSACTSLKEIKIPESVTTIGNYAFNYCLGLTSVTIPANVTKIGIAAFKWCDPKENGSLTSAVFKNVENWKVTKNNASINLSNTVLSNYSDAAKYLYNTYSEYIWTRSE